jgi:hypothetical protein
MVVNREADVGDERELWMVRGWIKEYRCGVVRVLCKSSASAPKGAVRSSKFRLVGSGGTGGISSSCGELPRESIDLFLDRFGVGPLQVLRLFNVEVVNESRILELGDDGCS